MARSFCLDCKAPCQGSRCGGCKAARARERDARRGTTTQRGLGWEHQQQRQRMLDQAGPLTHCPRCEQPITKSNPITGEHGVARAHGGTEITELMCRSCNSSLGGSIRRHPQ